MKIKFSFHKIFLVYLILISTNLLVAQSMFTVNYKTVTSADVKVGAQCTEKYFPLIKGKNIGVVANQTSLINKTHLVDSLLKSGFQVKKIFCPEHGFRGDADAGEQINDMVDSKTKLPIISLYGKNFKPKATDLKGLDIVIFDIQDVGVRFYTYISTLHYVMEACAENNIPLIVLDRPNPNGYYIDGPVLEKGFNSFVGMHPVPLVYGMTIAEYATMVNQEGWLLNGVKCKLSCVPIENYKHTFYYILPVKPSPNLPTMSSVYLYPSLGLFEGTVISAGRGTDRPFQVIGHPKLTETSYSFTPKSMSGASNPLYKDTECKGYDLKNFADIYIKNTKQLYLFWLMGCYTNLSDKQNFFLPSFDKLAGNSKLREQIIKGTTEEEIRKSWQPDIDKFKQIRKKYLLYTDFE